MAKLRRRHLNTNRASGYTLVEVVVAMLLTAVIVTSVFSVALTSKSGGGKGQRKLKAAEGANLVAALLQNYVTGSHDPASVIPGPGTGANSWSLDSPPFQDERCVDCWALAPGDHEISGVMGAFENPPYNARVHYNVSNDAAPEVKITVKWDEP